MVQLPALILLNGWKICLILQVRLFRQVSIKTSLNCVSCKQVSNMNHEFIPDLIFIPSLENRLSTTKKIFLWPLAMGQFILLSTGNPFT